jgi:uncharacterized lipoprotein YajG
MRAAFLFAAAIVLAGCATAPPPIFVRTDGRSINTDPILGQQFQLDKTVCLGNREKADLSGVTVSGGGLAGVIAAQNRSQAADAVFVGCMAEKGYMLTTADKAGELAAENAGVAAESQGQTAAQAPRR